MTRAMPRRTILSWSQPLLPAAVDYLCAEWRGGLLDLSSLTVVVPTAEAGRRLRGALALRAAEGGAAVLAPQVITPELITTWALQEMPAAAEPAEELLAWMKVLMELPLEKYHALFPVLPVARDTGWARGTAAELLRLRHRLEEGGLNIAEAARRLGATHPEAERWKDLSRLETRVTGAMQRAGLTDPLAARITASEKPVLPSGVSRVVLLAVPDPVLLVISALENLERQGAAVDVVIHGDAAQDTLWDDWGRPVPEAWAERVIAIPHAEERIRLVSRPEDQAAALLAALQSAAAIGSADPEVAAPLADAAARAGLAVFDPNGQPLSAHEISWLLHCLTNLLRSDLAVEAARLLRVPEVLRAAHPGVSAAALLRDWDEFSQNHLPRTLADAIGLSKNWKPRRRETPSLLPGAFTWLSGQCLILTRGSGTAAIHAFLDSLYAGRTFTDESVRALFTDALNQWREALDSTARAAARTGFDADTLTLLETATHLLRDARLYPDNADNASALHGWLELAWLDSPHLAVAGLNEGLAPDSITGDPWLPDSIRGLLDLKTNAVRLARDSYLLTSLLECRRRQGSVTLLAARESSSGDPLKPSRLLLRCPHEELASRALRLFPDSELEDARPSPPAWHRAWKLRVPAPDTDAAVFTKLSVTQFSDYLACPFRFYLKHVLHMEPFDASRDEMDPRDFGSLVHDTLEALHKDDALRDSAEEPAIAAFLDDKIQALTALRYGRDPALPLVIQLESTRNRLRALARVHAQQRADGWRVEHTEVSFPELPGNNQPVEIDGVIISGRIDLMERRINTPQRRLLDYKTSAKGTRPAEAHLKSLRGHHDYPDWQFCTYNGKPHRWINLQLPLYASIVSTLPGYGNGMAAGYFNLPPAVSETAVNMWDELTDELMASARECARGVIRSIRAGIFWPPASRVEYDDFEPLTFGVVTESFDATLLEKFRELQTR